jgi:ATP-dependent Clp protease ATP-binding subunit ClpB
VEEDSPLAILHGRVTSDDIVRVVVKATGIPVQNLLKGERDKLVHVRAIARPTPGRIDVVNAFSSKVGDALREHVVGLDHVVEAISDTVRISRAGLQAPKSCRFVLVLGADGCWQGGVFSCLLFC